MAGESCKPFPYALANVLMVGPGTYRLYLWLAPTLRSGDNQVLPNPIVGLKGCTTTLVVTDGQGATVKVVAGIDKIPPKTCVTE